MDLRRATLLTSIFLALSVAFCLLAFASNAVAGPSDASYAGASYAAPPVPDVQPAPSFDGLGPTAAAEKLSDFAAYYRGMLAQVNSAASSGKITSQSAGDARSTLTAQIAQLNANYFAWRDAYNASQVGSNPSHSSGDVPTSGTGSGSGTSGTTTPSATPSSGSNTSSGSSSGSPSVSAPVTKDPTAKKNTGNVTKPSPKSNSGKTDSGKTQKKSNTDGSNEPLGAAGTVVPTAAASTGAANGSGKNGSGSGSAGKHSKSKDSNSDGARRQEVISRAVDRIPLLFRAALLGLLFAVALLAVVSFRERRRAKNTERVSQLDYLTGHANREGFDRALSLEWRRALRYGRPLGLVFVDLDHFKSYNDTNGHLAGDRLLREIAAAINATARGSDFTARLGGDEFVIVCPETTPQGLERLATRLEEEAKPLAVTLSIGYAHQLATDSEPEELIARADASMYRAKGGGRRGSGTGNPMLGSIHRGPRV